MTLNDIENNNNDHNRQFMPMYDEGVNFPSYSNNFQPLKIEKDDKEDRQVTCSIVLFVLGFLLLIPWIINVINIKSKNKMARGFSIASVVLFSLSIAVIVIFVIFIIILITSFHNSHREDR
ncbi:hypothetical protein ACTFIY_007330 [Dictyostelium cf. discoideum]